MLLIQLVLNGMHQKYLQIVNQVYTFYLQRILKNYIKMKNGLKKLN